MAEDNIVQPDSDNEDQTADLDWCGRFNTRVAEAAPQYRSAPRPPPPAPTSRRWKDGRRCPCPPDRTGFGEPEDRRPYLARGQETPREKGRSHRKSVSFHTEWALPLVAVGDVAVAVTHHKGGKAQIGKDSEHERIIASWISSCGLCIGFRWLVAAVNRGQRSIAMLTVYRIDGSLFFQTSHQRWHALASTARPACMSGADKP